MTAMKNSTDLPFIPECEILYEGGENCLALFDGCKKNPGHSNFIPVSDFTMEDLPVEWRDQTHMDFIKNWCDLTVKVVVNYTSPCRPDKYPDKKAPYPYSNFKGKKGIKRCGTGYMDNYPLMNLTEVEDSTCPCPICKESPHPKSKYVIVDVHTAKHVIYDDVEAAHSVFECFYDSEDRKGVRYLYGVEYNYHSLSVEGERCEVQCVTHDEELIKKLYDLSNPRFFSFKIDQSHGVMISHPHGHCKHITVGKILCCTFPKISTFPFGVPHEFGNEGCCRLPIHSISSTFCSPTYDSTVDKIPTSESSQGHCQTSANGTSSIHNAMVDINKLETLFDLNDSNSSHSIFLIPGQIYPLPPGLTFTVPPDAKYLCRCHEVCFDMRWVTFPPDTRFTLPDGGELHMPEGTEFFLQGLSENDNMDYSGCLTYNIDSCPGSSGAKVIFKRKFFMFPKVGHAGCLSNGSNLSDFGHYHVG